MKRFMVNWLVVAVCLFLCVGCSSLKPTQGQSTAAPPAPEKAAAEQNYPMKWFVHGWLTGDAPPPDFTPGAYKDEWGSGIVGLACLIAQCVKK